VDSSAWAGDAGQPQRPGTRCLIGDQLHQQADGFGGDVSERHVESGPGLLSTSGDGHVTQHRHGDITWNRQSELLERAKYASTVLRCLDDDGGNPLPHALT